MLWEVEILPIGSEKDYEGQRILASAKSQGISGLTSVTSAKTFLIQGDLTRDDANQPAAYSYGQTFQGMRDLRLLYTAAKYFYWRMVPNVMARNQDDTGNSFLLTDTTGHGSWPRPTTWPTCASPTIAGAANTK